MENNILETVARSLNVELPYRENLDEYLDMILPVVRRWGEDINEVANYSVKGGKPWLEVRDEENFHNVVVHFFNEGGEYLKSIDGNVMRGKWRILEGTNKIIIELGGGGKPVQTELYELAYLDQTFFILKKHGNQQRNRKYFAMGFELSVAGLEWRDYVELLFNNYRRRHQSYRLTVGFVAVVILIILIYAFF